MPAEVHPAIAKRVRDLFTKARELVAAQHQNLTLLAKTIDIKDEYSMKLRVAEVVSFTPKIQWIAAQLDLLKSLPYDMAAAEATRVTRKMHAVDVTSMLVEDELKAPKSGDGER